MHFLFSQFNCCLTVVLSFGKGALPENWHVLYCHMKLAFPLTLHVYFLYLILER